MTFRALRAIGFAAIFGCAGDATAPSNAPVPANDPALAEIVTSDLARFWAAYDASGKKPSVALLQAQYFDSATLGLRAFVNLRALNATNLAATISAYPRYFASIRQSSLGLATNGAVTGQIRANFATIKALYPAAVFPPVTLLIGRFSTGGTTSEVGIMIGSEFYTATADSPRDELSQYQNDNVQTVDGLPVIVAHEHAHVLQSRARGIFGRTSLLNRSLLEGGADFIGERSSGGNINRHLMAFGIAHEAALWAEFKAIMHGDIVSGWLYNQSTAPPDRPGDLGYFIGYRIAEAYYAKATDKAAALRDIIEIRDADDFLAKSGYSP